ncbi:MerR family transcriptional regulator [Clostridium senegalense]|uniref:MerR family transcriptional regulator n=1 Tax=Clostridium senegalense TaxID=1465809 RepID=A0A6M0H2Y8_9CLOT|nr:MerR family transcriptional regulator [Clostridium senegalense]NEU04473.1 MerR family transcriptional regulator [Clostridium senegalense]
MGNNVKDKYFTVSEFAKLCGVQRKTLIFYDKIGIFSPEYRDENNYRLYSLSQYDTFTILLELRELDVSLDEIKKYLYNRTPQEYIRLLKDEKSKATLKIKKLEKMIYNLTNKIGVAQKGMKEFENNKVYIKKCEEEYLILSDLSSSSQNEIMMDVINFVKYCDENNIYDGYPIGAIVRKSDVENKKFNTLSKLFIKLDNKINNNKLFIKPSVKYVCINHKGDYESTYKSYEKILKFVKENNYKIIGDSYENTLLDFFALKNEKEYLTEIMIRVEKI